MAAQTTIEQELALVKRTQPQLSEDAQMKVAQNNFIQKNNAYEAEASQSKNLFQSPTDYSAIQPQAQQPIDQVATAPTKKPEVLPSGNEPAATANDGGSYAIVKAMYDNPEYKKAMEANANAARAGIEDQKGSAAQIQKMLEDVANKQTSVDLSPLLAYADSWTGHNISKGYTRPETPEQKLAMMQNLQESLRKAKGGVSEADLSLLRSQGEETKNRLLNLTNAAIADKKAAGDKKSVRDSLHEEQMISNWNNKEGTVINGLGEIANSAKGILSEAGNGDINLLDPQVRSKIATLLVNYNSNIAHLGALSGEDLGLLRGAAGVQPNEIYQWIYDRIGNNANETKNILQQMIDKADFRVNDIVKKATPTVKDAAQNALGQYQKYKNLGNTPTDQTTTNQDTVTVSKGDGNDLIIQKSDLEAAKAEGYKVVK